MKTSLVTVALVAVVSSLVTAGAIELLRGPRPGLQPAHAIEAPPGSREARAPRVVEPLAQAPPAPVQPTDQADRLAELERRLAALELGSTSRRAPVTAAPSGPSGIDALPAQDDLRELVLDWVAEERETRRNAEELAQVKDRRKELEFDARFTAFMLAREHDLADWQQESLAAVLLEIEVRRAEFEQQIDPLTDDPEQVEARWVEFDEWADQYGREQLGPLYEQLYGDD